LEVHSCRITWSTPPEFARICSGRDGLFWPVIDRLMHCDDFVVANPTRWRPNGGNEADIDRAVCGQRQYMQGETQPNALHGITRFKEMLSCL
jgi:hypothetical protein